MTGYTTKDSGQRQEFSSGMHRDTESGKPRFDLIVPEGIPYEEQLLTRFAALMARGAEKYTERNWEQANSEEEINRARSSAFRHFFQWFCGERDEDHAVAVLFNIMVVETTRAKLDRANTPPSQEEIEQALRPFRNVATGRTVEQGESDITFPVDRILRGISMSLGPTSLDPDVAQEAREALQRYHNGSGEVRTEDLRF